MCARPDWVVQKFEKSSGRENPSTSGFVAQADTEWFEKTKGMVCSTIYHF